MSRLLVMLAVVVATGVTGCGGAPPPRTLGLHEVEVRRYEENAVSPEWTYDGTVVASLSGDSVTVQVSATRFKVCSVVQRRVVHRTEVTARETLDLGESDEVIEELPIQESRCQIEPAAGAAVSIAGRQLGNTDDAGAFEASITNVDLLAVATPRVQVGGQDLPSQPLIDQREWLVAQQAREEAAERAREIQATTAKELKTGVCDADRAAWFEEVLAMTGQLLEMMNMGGSTTYAIVSSAVFVATSKGRDFVLEEYSWGTFDVISVGVGTQTIEVRGGGHAVGEPSFELSGFLAAQLFGNEREVPGLRFEADASVDYVLSVEGEGCALMVVIKE